jgi:hypothetical protein
MFARLRRPVFAAAPRVSAGTAGPSEGFRIADEPVELAPPELRAISFRPLPDEPAARAQETEMPVSAEEAAGGGCLTVPAPSARAADYEEDPAELVWAHPLADPHKSGTAVSTRRSAIPRLVSLLALVAALGALVAVAFDRWPLGVSTEPRSARPVGHAPMTQGVVTGARRLRHSTRRSATRSTPKVEPRRRREQTRRVAGRPGLGRATATARPAVAPAPELSPSAPVFKPAPSRRPVATPTASSTPPMPRPAPAEPAPAEVEFGFEETGEGP